MGVIEWTEYILKHFEHTLRPAGIYGAVGRCVEAILRALGSSSKYAPSGVGEVGISLYNLERITGLLILGDVYEEFLPHNDDLMGDGKFSPTVLELLRIHVELCHFHKSNHRTSSKPPQASQRGCPLTLNAINIGELAAFLAFWFSYFVLAYHNEVIRPETFVMASLTA
ncbi:hypothetical protein Cgig2_003572 [Carnegiea gigantea]|uniref:Aminotransferase-like plant mobile domain-containing protein n=1 Tax=Carnegiea gigantea TaxID=171969 RepID=A0A9Q1Q913_9CARY|nr:hypothetical protein Cgig2_003572 [Carnegiea gigantea]